MLKQDPKTEFDFVEIFDRARDLHRELVRSRAETREVEITVVDDGDGDGGGAPTVVGRCQVTVKADTLREAKAAYKHLTGTDHNCTCKRDGRIVTCDCP